MPHSPFKVMVSITNLYVRHLFESGMFAFDREGIGFAFLLIRVYPFDGISCFPQQDIQYIKS